MTQSAGYKSHNENRSRGFAAVFIDFENIFYFLKDNYADLPDLNDYVFDMLRNLRQHLERRLGLQSIIMKAYADFEQLKSTPQGSLYLMGVETHNVLGTDHKNAADMRLCIDALEVLYTRPEIDAFVFVAGDRDYIPVIQHLKKQARTVYAVAFRGNISGDLLQNIGSRYFIDAVTLIDGTMLRRLEDSARRQQEIERIEFERDVIRTAELEEREAHERRQMLMQPDAGGMTIDLIRIAEAIEPLSDENDIQAEPNRNGFHQPDEERFNAVGDLASEAEQICLEVLLRNYGRHHEVWMSPFLRKLSDALPRLADFERKALLTSLEHVGAIRIEKRRGEPYDYSIILVNYNHPAVRELMPG